MSLLAAFGATGKALAARYAHAFIKIPPLRTLAPAQTDPPFIMRNLPSWF